MYLLGFFLTTQYNPPLEIWAGHIFLRCQYGVRTVLVDKLEAYRSIVIRRPSSIHCTTIMHSDFWFSQSTEYGGKHPSYSTYVVPSTKFRQDDRRSLVFGVICRLPVRFAWCSISLNYSTIDRTNKRQLVLLRDMYFKNTVACSMLFFDNWLVRTVIKI